MVIIEFKVFNGGLLASERGGSIVLMHTRRICIRTFHEAKLSVAHRQVHLSHLVPDAKEELLDDMSSMDAHSHKYT